MTLLLDNNLSPRIVRAIESAFPGTSHVMLVGLDRAADSIVWQYARDHQYTIVTRDADFNYLLGLHGMPPKVIWIRRGNCKTNEIVDLLLAAADAIKAFEINPQLALLELY